MRINPALAELELLVGRWRMELYGATFLPDPDTRVTGSLDVAWIDGGAALLMRQGDSEHPPAADWIVGRDETEAEYAALYADDRGVSRMYRMNFADPHWQMWRTTPDFSQRFHAELDRNRHRMSGRWEKSVDQGASWEHDFNIDYIRES